MTAVGTLVPNRKGLTKDVRCKNDTSKLRSENKVDWTA